VRNFVNVNFFKLLDKPALMQSEYFKASLLKYMKASRLQYAEYGNEGLGLDFNFIDYSINNIPPNAELHNIVNAAINFMFDEFNKNDEYSKIPTDLKRLYNFNDHYLLLTAIAITTDSKKVVEVGTASGSSLWALLNGPIVKEVNTWDIIPIKTNTSWFANDIWKEYVQSFLEKDTRWTQHIESLIDDEVWAIKSQIFVEADLIFIDGPHDVEVFEKKLIQNLLSLKNEKRIILIFDDILLSDMIDFWKWLPLPKLDISAVGHQSGTGIAMLEPFTQRKTF